MVLGWGSEVVDPRWRRRRRRRRRRKNFPACPDPYPNAPRDEISRKGKPLTLMIPNIPEQLYVFAPCICCIFVSKSSS